MQEQRPEAGPWDLPNMDRIGAHREHQRVWPFADSMAALGIFPMEFFGIGVILVAGLAVLL